MNWTFDLQLFGSTNNAGQQNTAAIDQIKAAQNNAQQLLQQYLSSNPFPLNGISAPKPPPQLGGNFGGGTFGGATGGSIAPAGGPPAAPPGMNAAAPRQMQPVGQRTAQSVPASPQNTNPLAAQLQGAQAQVQARPQQGARPPGQPGQPPLPVGLLALLMQQRGPGL